jgi:hypothetical protein
MAGACTHNNDFILTSWELNESQEPGALRAVPIQVSGTLKLTYLRMYVRVNIMRANRLQDALKHLGEALREAENALEEARGEPDPLASHIFVSRRHYRNISDTKSGKRSETAARMSWQTACKLGFRGNLGEWERLMGAASKR